MATDALRNVSPPGPDDRQPGDPGAVGDFITIPGPELGICVCGHLADEHDVDASDVLGECRSPECPCIEFLLNPETQTAPEVTW